MWQKWAEPSSRYRSGCSMLRGPLNTIEKKNRRKVSISLCSSYGVCSSLTPEATGTLLSAVVSDAMLIRASPGISNQNESSQPTSMVSAFICTINTRPASNAQIDEQTSKFDILRFSFFNQIYNWWPSAWYWSVCWELKTITFRPPLVHRIEKS